MNQALPIDRHMTRSHNSAGYSLLELLIVLVIIGLLGALVGPRLIAQLDSSKIQTAETQIRQLKSALDIMRLDLGRYPTQEEGLPLLVTPPNDASIKPRWRGPYLEGELPKDPWGNAYIYGPTSKPNQPFALYSNGQTGRPGGEGANGPVGLLP